MDAKTKKMVIAGSLIGAIIIVASAIIIRKRNKRRNLEKAILESGDSNTADIDDKPVGKLVSWPLVPGSGKRSDSERAIVKTVQEYLNKKILENNIYALPILVVDGYFGPKTQNALYKIAGVNEVSYSLYVQMWNYNTEFHPTKQYSYKPEL